jgi:DNA-directed RNA polymerase subunit omega
MDETRIRHLASRAGGRFRLASLVQKRLLQLNRGQRQLTEEDHRNPLYTVLREIEEGKIGLVEHEEEEETKGGSMLTLDSPPEETRRL